MNPQQDQTPGLPLPQPSFDVAPAPAGVPVGNYQQPGQGVGMPSQVPAGAFPGNPQPVASQQPAMPGVAPQQQAAAVPMPMAPAPDVVEASAGPEDETALDQEWVAKAREIVLRTHADPYLQSQELSKIKAQYIKVRYNKDIKTADE